MASPNPARPERPLRTLGVREECSDGVRYLVSTVPMMHDAVAYSGHFLVSSRGLLLIAISNGAASGKQVVVLEVGASYADGSVSPPCGSAVRLGDAFSFDRGFSTTWTVQQILSIMDDEEADGVVGIGF